MATPTTGVRRRPKDRKEQILTAARELIVEFGFRNVSMAQLAERVGITAGGLYRHFANKSVLLVAVIGRSLDEVAPVFDSDAPLAEVLHRNARRTVARRYVGALWVRESRNLPDTERRTLLRRLRGFNTGYVDAILRERPELDPAGAARLAWGVMAVFASASFHTTKIDDAELAAVLASSALALCMVDPIVESEPERHGPALQPVSMRERLLAHAIILFEQRGYEATGLDDIAAAAGVTGPNLYGYFDSKADILATASARGTTALWLLVHTALRDNDDPAAALHQLVNGYVDLTLTRTVPTSMLLTEPSLSEESARARQREIVAEWVALLRAARADDETSARVRVHTALGVIHIMSTLEPAPARSSRFPDLAAMATAVLFAPGDANLADK